MRFQVMWKKTHLPPEAYRPFFETDSIDEAKDFAMRLAFDETNHVYVQDTRRWDSGGSCGPPAPSAGG